MIFEPINEDKAKDQVKIDYQKIKKALESSYLPLFFTYVGPFPEYLNYLTEQLVPLLQNYKFNMLIRETEEKLSPLIREGLMKSEEINEWLERYRHSPFFYNFQTDLSKIFSVNLKLAFIFVALREALKGWAIAAKKLSAVNRSGQSSANSFQKVKDFIQEDTSLLAVSQNQISDADRKIDQSGKIEKDLLPRYIFLCHQEYNQLMKTERHLILRVGIEKLILSSLPLLPEKIVSPINVFYNLTIKYEEFPELLYLMYEHFPTYAVQKMMFAGFMKE